MAGGCFRSYRHRAVCGSCEGGGSGWSPFSGVVVIWVLGGGGGSSVCVWVGGCFCFPSTACYVSWLHMGVGIRSGGCCE